jgi:uncharacterized protein (TIGR03382 family)
MRVALWVLVLFTAGSALAEPDTFGLGTGRNGSVRFEGGTHVVNRYAQLTASTVAGARDLSLSDSTSFVAGGLVLLHQSTGLTPTPDSGDQRRLSLNSGTVGRFEYARVESVGPGSLRLTAPLLYGYPGGMTQVVTVPEYTELEVRGATLRAAPWDGKVGGILALFASGRLRNEGLITVDGAGLRGGTFFDSTGWEYCSALDEPVATGGSYKGEGLVAGRYNEASGRGNLANGGGGGNCHNAGGGGGGHAGMGGVGGRTAPLDGEREVGGLGGAPLTYVPYERLVFGGGGGAGEGNDSDGTSGGAGGGIILIRAAELRGSQGLFSANGATPPPTPGDDGAGGGGAGGAISLRISQDYDECGPVQARGGAGGDVTEPGVPIGPGGGGGGGFIFIQAPTVACPPSVVAGAPGKSAAIGTSHGAGPASTSDGPSVGSVQILKTPFRSPGSARISQPAEGSMGVSPRPRILGTAEASARVHLFLDGAPFATVEADANGSFAFDVSTDLTPGPHQLTASSEVLGVRSIVSEPRRFSVVAPQGDGGTPDAGTPPDGGSPDGGDGEPVPDAGSQPPEERGPPILVVPAQGERVGPTPLFSGTATQGGLVSITVDDVEVAQAPVDAEGRFRYTPTAEQALAPGEHRATVRVVDGTSTARPASQPTSFEVTLTNPEVGCGCGASPGTGLGALAVLLGLRLARRRRGAPSP